MERRRCKRVFAFALCLALCTPLFFSAAAFSATGSDAFNKEKIARSLNALGLFSGIGKNADGSVNFELSRTPTRLEALVMFVRLLGKGSEAEKYGKTHPFADVPAWADGYVSYAYASGLTNGIGDASFGSGIAASSCMYLTLILRALGYSDAQGDFAWDAPYALAMNCGLLPKGVNTVDFRRADMALVSYAALRAHFKNSAGTLADKLISDGVFTKSRFEDCYDATVLYDPDVSELTYLAAFSKPEKLCTVGGVEVWANKDYVCTLPFEDTVTRSIVLKNAGSKPVKAAFDNLSVSGDVPGIFNVDAGSLHPQSPSALYIEPGRCGVIQMSLAVQANAVSNLPSSFYDKSAISSLTLSVFGYDEGFGEYRDLIEKKTVSFNYTVSAMRAQDMPSKANATISGHVRDASGAGLPGISVLIDCGAYKTVATTDSKGFYSAKVYAYQKTYSAEWRDYTVTANPDKEEMDYCAIHNTKENTAYSSGSVTVQPTAGGSATANITLSGAPAAVSYKLTGSVETYINNYDFDASSDGSVIATVPFHCEDELSMDYIKSHSCLTAVDKTGKLLFQRPLGWTTSAIDVTPDGRYIATCMNTAEKTDSGYGYNITRSIATIFDASGDIVYQAKGLPRPAGIEHDCWTNIREVRISGDDKYLFLGDIDGAVAVVDWQNNSLLWTAWLHNQVRYAEFDLDDAVVYVSSSDGYLYCFDAATGKILWKCYVNSWLTAMDISASYIACSSKSAGNNLFLINKYTGECVWADDTGCRASHVAISPDEKYVWFGNDTMSAISSIGNSLYSIDGTLLWSSPECCQCASWTRDNKLILKNAYDLVVYNVNGDVLCFLNDVAGSEKADKPGVSAVLWASEDGRYVVASYNSNETGRFYGQLYFFEKQ